jgi:hypothetical protein
MMRRLLLWSILTTRPVCSIRLLPGSRGFARVFSQAHSTRTGRRVRKFFVWGGPALSSVSLFSGSYSPGRFFRGVDEGQRYRRDST